MTRKNGGKPKKSFVVRADEVTMTRRQLLAGSAAMMLPLETAFAQEPTAQTIAIDPAPRFALSPYLYMQFMEPLGATDASVEAAWEHLRDDWREDVVAVTRELAPTMLRWGGIFLDFYRWREGVGPREKRPPMLNLLWGGIESNQVGTAEFVDFARRVGAEPLICVNFESDGRKRYMQTKGSIRTADAKEAADWVRYCNDPASAERRAHGRAAPHAVKYWQIGNETSYDRQGFDLETAARKTVEFATCSPTRNALYTGLYPVRSGAHPNHTWVKDGTKSIVHYLQALGYRVGPEAYGIRSVRDARYKYILNLNADGEFQNATTDNKEYFVSWRRKAETDAFAREQAPRYLKRPAVEFYDLETDPYEMNNLAALPQSRAAMKRLRAQLDARMKQQGDQGVATEMDALNRMAKHLTTLRKKETR